MKNNVKISFFGAAQEVTGSNYLIEAGDGANAVKILVDCGFFQGSKISEDKNYEKFLYNPSEIDALIITHAHLDHIGRIPKLVRERFKGKIFSTFPTRDLGNLMLEDSLGVLRKEALRDKRKKTIYEESDIRATMEKWEAVEYGANTSFKEVNFVFKEAGHILGSAMVEMKINGKKILFSGDVGGKPEPFLKEAEKVKDADFMVVESTYGDRLHEKKKEAELKLERVIEDAIKRGGVLMLPAFSLERTQKIFFHINDLVEHGRIPRIPIFLDSPLSIKATKIYREYSKYFSESAKNIIRSGDDIFNFPGLKLSLTTEESKAINDVPSPKIIIAGSGMCNGGRITHHLRRYLSDPKNTLLFVSYQAAGSLGRKIYDGEKVVNIFGDSIPVSAHIEKIDGYSSHFDSDGIFEFVSDSTDTLKKVFVTHGEPKASLFIVQKIRDHLGLEAVAPKFGESYEI